MGRSSREMMERVWERGEMGVDLQQRVCINVVNLSALRIALEFTWKTMQRSIQICCSSSSSIICGGQISATLFALKIS